MIHGSIIGKMDFWINIIYIILLPLLGISMFLKSKKVKKRAPRERIVDINTEKYYYCNKGITRHVDLEI